jgi:PTS system mannitol-specific IIA component
MNAADLRRLLPPESIDLDATETNREDAIRHAGALLMVAGSIEPEYIERMLEREQSVSTYVGDGIAMPHGTLQSKSEVNVEGLALLRLAHPIDWGGERVSIVIGIAAHDRRYIALLSHLASVLLEDGAVTELSSVTNTESVYELLSRREI